MKRIGLILLLLLGVFLLALFLAVFFNWMVEDSTRIIIVIAVFTIILVVNGCYSIAGWILLDRYNKKFDEEIKNPWRDIK